MPEEGPGVVAFLASLKKGRRSRPPRDPEPLAVLYARAARGPAEILASTYTQLRDRGPPLYRLAAHLFTRDAQGAVRLVWWELPGPCFFVRGLNPRPARRAATFFGWAERSGACPTPCRGRVAPAVPFRVEDLKPGERFRTAAGQPAKRAVGRPGDAGTFVVWLSPDTLEPRQTTLPRGSEVFALDQAHAHRIRRRRDARERRVRPQRILPDPSCPPLPEALPGASLELRLVTPEGLRGAAPSQRTAQQEEPVMDPQRVWELLIEAHVEGDLETAAEHAEELLDWLNKGGAPPVLRPDEEEGPFPEWDREHCERACRQVLLGRDQARSRARKEA